MRKCETFRQTLAVTASMLALLSSGAALAQDQTISDTDSKSTIVLDTVSVTGQADEETDGPVNGYVAQKSSTASKTGASIMETPLSVTVIGSDEMEDRAVQTVTQALAYTPGVFTSTSAASQRFDYFDIRGFDATNTGILLDGLRTTTQQSYVRYQPYGMERTEVLRGPSSVLYGANSLGGVVNLISKRPTEEAQHEVGVQIGNNNRVQAQFDLSGPLTEDKKFLYRLVGVGRQSDTQFDYVPDDTQYIAPSITWQPNSDTALTVLTSYSHDDFGPSRPYLPLYGTLLSNENGKVPWNTNLNGKDLENYNDQTNLEYIFDRKINDIWSFNSKARYTHNDLFTQTFMGLALASDMRTLSRRAYEFEIVGDILATDNSAKAEWSAGMIDGTSVVGLSYRHTDEDYYLNYGSAESIDIYNPTYGYSFSATTPYTKTNQSSNEFGVYTAHTLKFGKHVVLDFGGRQDWSHVDTDNLLEDTSTSQDDDAFTYRAGLTYVTDFGLAPYVSYATSFSPVLGTNVYGDSYKPTEGKQWEIGAKYKPDALDALFTVAYYDLTQTNVSQTDPDNSLNTIQTGEVQSQGIELSATANITPALKVLASYTYNDQEVTKSTDSDALGNRPTAQPAQMASVWGDYTFQPGSTLNGFGVGGGVRYIGETYADSANTITVPDFTLVDAAVRYDLGALKPDLTGATLGLNATNLFNKHYYSSCTTSSCTEGYGRTVMATLSYRW